MLSLVFDISIPAQEFLRVYQGTANRVLIRSRTGRTISLPARHLQPFLTRNGISGSFIIEFNAQGQLLDLRRLA